MTLSQVSALVERRFIRHKYACYEAGLVAATLINLKQSPGSDLVTAWDFVPQTVDPVADRRNIAKKNTFALFALLADKGLLPTNIDSLRERTVQGMLNEGITDADAVWDEVFNVVDNSGNK